MGFAVPQEQEKHNVNLAEPVDGAYFENREIGLRAAMTLASTEAILSGELLVINACLGAARCKPGTDSTTCLFCERIECHPSGEIRHFKPGEC